MKLTAIGIARKGGPFKITTEPAPHQPAQRTLPPGQYNKFQLAATDPKLYAELVRAGLPAIGDGRAVMVTITGDKI